MHTSPDIHDYKNACLMYVLHQQSFYNNRNIPHPFQSQRMWPSRYWQPVYPVSDRYRSTVHHQMSDRLFLPAYSQQYSLRLSVRHPLPWHPASSSPHLLYCLPCRPSHSWHQAPTSLTLRTAHCLHSDYCEAPLCSHAT